MSRTYRRSAHVEAVAPWMALSVILLMWWGGAKAITWMRPHVSSSPSAPISTAAAIDAPQPKEQALSAAPKHSEPTMTATVSVTGDDLANLRGRDLMIPVRGVPAGALVSSFADARSGHTHEAIDILAPRGTEVMAVEDGKVAKLFTSVAGGLTIYEFDPKETFVYYYAHLDSYAAGLKEGNEVKRGQVIGYVGTTGNAPKNTPHLHFAISKLDPDRRWWGGTALDPFLVWRG
jgi:murein DD-endopeptidase MepM/ murein hydrolase activator NlpD